MPSHEGQHALVRDRAAIEAEAGDPDVNPQAKLMALASQLHREAVRQRHPIRRLMRGVRSSALQVPHVTGTT